MKRMHLVLSVGVLSAGLLGACGGGGGGDGQETPPVTYPQYPGRFVAFASAATNLVAGDTNGKSDIFVHDRETGETIRVSVAADGSEANGDSWGPEISEDGRIVAFLSQAANLIPDDTNDHEDLFVLDRVQMTIKNVTKNFTWNAAPILKEERNEAAEYASVSANGQYVAFASRWCLDGADGNRVLDIFIYSVLSDTTQRVVYTANGQETDSDSYSPTISDDGLVVTFVSEAANLVLPLTSGTAQVYVRNLKWGKNEMISASVGSQEGNAPSMQPRISANGRYVAFASYATNLVSDTPSGTRQAYVCDLWAPQQGCVPISISQGEFLQGTTSRPSISDDGRYALFSFSSVIMKEKSPLPDLLLKDLQALPGSKEEIRTIGTKVLSGWMTSDGNQVIFDSKAWDLAPDDANEQTDVFQFHRENGTIDRVSVDSSNTEGNGPSFLQARPKF